MRPRPHPRAHPRPPRRPQRATAADAPGAPHGARQRGAARRREPEQFITHALADALGPQAGEDGGPEKPAPAPRWVAAAMVTNIVLLAIAGILALILLFVAWQGA